MFRTRHFSRGLPGARVVIALVGALLVVGCSSDSVTMPAQLAATETDSDLTSIFNPKVRRIPTPAEVTVTDLCSSGAVVRWRSPGHGYRAQIRVDGVIIDQVRARDGYYLDALAKSCGEHTWGVCFTRTGTDLAGAEVFVTQVMPGNLPPGPKDPSDRMERDN